LKNLYKHQEEAIRIGVSGKEFIVTSGTGSGKSLTFLATIFNHILNQGDLVTNKIQAVVVYPMNALINSQFKEIENIKTDTKKISTRPFQSLSVNTPVKRVKTKKKNSESIHLTFF